MPTNVSAAAGSPADFDHYGQVLDALNRGDYFVSNREVLLPKTEIKQESRDGSPFGRNSLDVPLQFAEVIWVMG
jgi:hypothetical protein